MINMNLKELSDIRTERAYSILKNGNPEAISEQEFLVPASNPEHKYKVTHIDSWTCECKDFETRCKSNGIYCKHIKAIQFFLAFKNKVEIDDLDIDKELNKEACIYCNSENIVRDGV